MPVFRILYSTPRNDHAILETLEWVADSDWTVERTRDCFHRRFPNAALVQLLEVDQCR